MYRKYVLTQNNYDASTSQVPVPWPPKWPAPKEGCFVFFSFFLFSLCPSNLLVAMSFESRHIALKSKGWRASSLCCYQCLSTFFGDCFSGCRWEKACVFVCCAGPYIGHVHLPTVAGHAHPDSLCQHRRPRQPPAQDHWGLLCLRLAQGRADQGQFVHVCACRKWNRSELNAQWTCWIWFTSDPDQLKGIGPKQARWCISLLPDQICLVQTWHSQPEPNQKWAGFAQYDPGCLWKNAVESENGKLVACFTFCQNRPDDSCTLACFQTRCIWPD